MDGLSAPGYPFSRFTGVVDCLLSGPLSVYLALDDGPEEVSLLRRIVVICETMFVLRVQVRFL